MMYRSGYAEKDSRQTNILGLKLKTSSFMEILSFAIIAEHASAQDEDSEKEGRVRIQWDPERTPSLQRLSYRSIQIGIPRELMTKFVDEWIVEIEDMTERARKMKRAVDEGEEDEILRLMPDEMVVDVPTELDDESEQLLRTWAEHRQEAVSEPQGGFFHRRKAKK